MARQQAAPLVPDTEQCEEYPYDKGEDAYNDVGVRPAVQQDRTVSGQDYGDPREMPLAQQCRDLCRKQKTGSGEKKITALDPPAAKLMGAVKDLLHPGGYRLGHGQLSFQLDQEGCFPSSLYPKRQKTPIPFTQNQNFFKKSAARERRQKF